MIKEAKESTFIKEVKETMFIIDSFQVDDIVRFFVKRYVVKIEQLNDVDTLITLKEKD